MINKNLLVFFMPLAISLCILQICFPGFMSYDSIQMLDEARSTVNGGIFPAAPVYILRFFDLTGYGPTLMVQSQNFILLFSVMLILRTLNASYFVSGILMLLLLMLPTVIGCMLVLWKDVTLTALIMFSIAITFWASQTNKQSTTYTIAKWATLLLLIVGTLVKFNAITSTVVITIYWISVFLKNKSFKFQCLTFFAIVLIMVASNKVVNEYSFPDFKRLQPNNILYGILANDLIGISKWSRVSLIPFDVVNNEGSQKTTIEEIDAIYSPLGSAVMHDNNVKLGSKVKVFPEKYNQHDIVSAWITAVRKYPKAYLKYRWDLFSEIIGATDHATYEPTHFNKIDENKFGITFKDRQITKVVLQYIETVSNMFFGKPWFIFLLSSISTLLIVTSKKVRHQSKMLGGFSFLASITYILPFFLVTLSGEVRYSFTAIVLSSISIFVLILSQPWRSDAILKNEN